MQKVHDGGSAFRSDFEVSGASENEALVQTGTSFSSLRASKKTMDFDAIFGRAPEEIESCIFQWFL